MRNYLFAEGELFRKSPPLACQSASSAARTLARFFRFVGKTKCSALAIGTRR